MTAGIFANSCSAGHTAGMTETENTITNLLREPVALYLDILQTQGQQSLREGDLLLWLRAQGWVDEALDEPSLYKVHFLMRNALYGIAREQPEWRWQFDALGVSWQPIQPARDDGGQWVEAGGAAAVQNYYEDWSNFDLSGEQVQSLLAGFWRRFEAARAGGDLSQALALLGFTELPDLPALKLAWRRRVAEAHPDRGGDNREVQALNEAYGEIKLFLKAQAL